MEVAKAVGLGDLTFFSKVGYGGGGRATVAHLAAAVATGQATVEWPGGRASAAAGPGRGRTPPSSSPRPPDKWTGPFGLLRPADEIGMLAAR